MRTLVARRYRERGVRWAVVGWGVALAAVVAVVLAATAPTPRAAAAMSLPAAVSVALVALGLHVRRDALDGATERARLTGKWVGYSALVGLFGSAWFLGLLVLLEGVPARPWLFVPNGVAVGMAYGTAIGYSRTRAARRTQTLECRVEDLETETARLDEFTATLAHDLRNPLTVARGNLELARERHDEGDTGPLTTVERALDRMEALVEDVLDRSRSSTEDCTTDAVSVADVADDAADTVDLDGASLAVTGDVTVAADRCQLRSLFENLYRNSVEHGSAGSRPETDGLDRPLTIRVGALDGPDRGFYVEDTGSGIERPDRAFDRDFSTGDGTGLGLAIVARVAETHGWEVTVGESVEGGARFEFHTGASPADPEARRASADT
jgi:signal transduction histidine kinase